MITKFRHTVGEILDFVKLMCMSLNKRKQINSKRSTEALILNMDQLAPEILFHIAKFLTPDEICNLRLTSNFFRNICDSEVIWHWLCKKQFGVTLSEVRYQDVVTYKKIIFRIGRKNQEIIRALMPNGY